MEAAAWGVRAKAPTTINAPKNLEICILKKPLSTAAVQQHKKKHDKTQKHADNTKTNVFWENPHHRATALYTSHVMKPKGLSMENIKFE